MNDRFRIDPGVLWPVFVQSFEPRAVAFQLLCIWRPSICFKLRRTPSLLPYPKTNELGSKEIWSKGK